MSGPSLISVQTSVVQETIVGRICERVAARLPVALPDPPSALLSNGVARAGYLTRVVECELFDAARRPMPGLAEDLHARVTPGSSWTQAAAAIARELAGREPLERADPGDPNAVSWRVPGPGGHVRHYVARRLIDEILPTGGALSYGSSPAGLKRDFVYGFVIRCCEEAAAPPAPSPQRPGTGSHASGAHIAGGGVDASRKLAGG